MSVGFGIFGVYWVLKSVKLHHFQQPARRRVVTKSVERCDFCSISGPQVTHGDAGLPGKVKQSETLGNSGKQFGAARRDNVKIVNLPFLLTKKCFRVNPFFETATGNRWKQSGLVPLTQQEKSYLELFRFIFFINWFKKLYVAYQKSNP